MFGKCLICGEQPTTAGAGAGCGRTKVWINGVPANQYFVAEAPKQGWQCPGCKRYVSPYEDTCPACEPPTYVVQSKTLQPFVPWQQPRNWTIQGKTEET